MDQLRLWYRDHDRTPLLWVIRDQAARFEELQLLIDHVPGSAEYQRGFLAGDCDLICEHLRFLFPARLAGEPIRFIAATEIQDSDCFVAAQPVRAAGDFDGKRIAVRAQESAQVTVSYWLRHLGVADRVSVQQYPDEEVGRWGQWRKVQSAEADIALCSRLYLEAPLAAGLLVAEISPLPVIGQLCFATRGPVIAARDSAVRRFVRAVYRGVNAFRNDPAYTVAMMESGPAALMGLADRAAVLAYYAVLRDKVAEKPIPLPECISNTFGMVQAVYDVAALSPLVMWDLRYVIELEEEYFMEQLQR
jgi:hypothetical protein